MAAASAHRFFNRNLRPLYAACPLPALRPPNNISPVPAHILRADSYLYTEHPRPLERPWKHTRFLPPSPWTRPTGVPPLSRPFNRFDPLKPKQEKSTANKKRKTDDASPSPAKEHAENVFETNGQKRKTKLSAEGFVFRTAKVRMWPTPLQRKEIIRCFDVCRFHFNWANECVQMQFCRPNHRALRDKARALKLMQTLPYANTPETAVSSDMVSHSIKQLTDAYASNYAKRKKDSTHTFHVKFRSKTKTPTEVIVIEKDRAEKKLSTLKRFEPCECKDKRSGRAACKAFLGNNFKHVGGILMQDSRCVIQRMVAEGDRLQEDAKIQWEKKTNSFYFIYTYKVRKPDDPDPDFMNKRMVATDPGCAPFQEWYSPTSGEFGALLDDGYPELRKRCHLIDRLQSRLDRRRNTPRLMILTQRRRENMDPHRMKRAHRGTTRRLKRKLGKERRRLHGYVKSAHYDAARFLLDKHDLIVVPKLRTSKLAKRRQALEAGRIFGNKMARAMYTWSHYLFRQRLISASVRFPGRHVFTTTEPGTSKTCTHCGAWNASLRLGDKVFRCPRCAIEVDRQLAGARNNFLAAYGMALGRHWDGVTQ